MSDVESTTTNDDVRGLLEEYLALREEGRTKEVDELMDRAGDQAPQLREQLQVFDLLKEMGAIIGEEIDEDAAPPDTVGRFEVVRLIGEGGLSRVFLGWDPVLQREVAIKILRPTAAVAKSDHAQIAAEGRRLAQLEHPSIVRVLDVGQTGKVAYIAMEFVKGPTLSTVLDVMRGVDRPEEAEWADRAREIARGLDSIGARCRLLLELARALEYCHERKIVHRDIKPGNVIIDADGTPKLIDFGLARLDSDDASEYVTNRLVGTPAYLAPEQVDLGRTGSSPASDQFSLGVVFYELLALKHPFSQGNRSGTLTAISRALPGSPRRFNLEVSIDAERICLHCLERSPSHRYPSISHLAADLENYLNHRAISVRAPSIYRQLRLLVLRRKSHVLAVGSVLLAVVLLLAGMRAWAFRQERTALDGWLDAQHAEIESLTDPEEFATFFSTLDDRRDDALRLDGAAFAQLGDARTPRLDLLWEAGCEQLDGVLAPTIERAERRRYYTDRVTKYRAMQATWMNVFYLQESSVPEEPVHSLIDLGMITFPSGGTLWRYQMLSTIPGDPRLTEYSDRDDLEPGFYRYEQSVNGQLRQVEFWFEASIPRWRVQPRPLAQWVEEELVPCELTDASLRSRFGSHRFLVHPDLVTWGDLQRAFAGREDTFSYLTTDSELIARADMSESGPAIIPWAYAQEYATLVGARLPQPLEVWLAVRDGVIELDEDIPEEWVASKFWSDERYALLYKYLEDEEPRFGQWVAPHLDIDLPNKTCFRVVVSTSPAAE